MYSKVGTWPNGGEIDIYENWNLANHNQPTFHTGDVPDVGRCNILDSGITGEMVRPDCSHNPDNTGCNVADKKGPWADANGGICTYSPFLIPDSTSLTKLHRCRRVD